jgi:hypothetical protein
MSSVPSRIIQPFSLTATNQYCALSRGERVFTQSA